MRESASAPKAAALRQFSAALFRRDDRRMVEAMKALDAFGWRREATEQPAAEINAAIGAPKTNAFRK